MALSKQTTGPITAQAMFSLSSAAYWLESSTKYIGQAPVLHLAAFSSSEVDVMRILVFYGF